MQEDISDIIILLKLLEKIKKTKLPGEPAPKELEELFDISAMKCLIEQKENEKKGIKKIKLNSIDDFHEACKEYARKNKNNFNFQDFFNTYDLQPVFEMLEDIFKNYEINNNIKEDENENTVSFENSSMEDSQEHGRNFNEHLFFM